MNTLPESSCVNRLKILADATRLAVVESLLDSPKHVGDLIDLLKVEQTLLSHHLKILRDAGLVESQRDGKSVLYRLVSDVEGTTSTRSINLGCCLISFDSTHH